nr:hypothetical protein [uncultured Desulfobulbus sp.]
MPETFVGEEKKWKLFSGNCSRHFYLENRRGANTMCGIINAAMASPDGYVGKGTLLDRSSRGFGGIVPMKQIQKYGM